MKTVDEKIEEGREYRDMTVTIVDEENNEEKQMIVEGYATTFDVPYDLYWLDENTVVREVVLKSSFDETDLNDVIMQYDHEGRVFARISNNTLNLKVDDNGLKVRADLGQTTIGRELYEEIEKGFTTKMSFGFIVEEDSIDEERSDDITIYTRTIRKISKVFDVSAVSLPANNNTSIYSARKHIDGLIEVRQMECLKREEERKAKELKIRKLRARIATMKGNKKNGN